MSDLKSDVLYINVGRSRSTGLPETSAYHDEGECLDHIAETLNDKIYEYQYTVIVRGNESTLAVLSDDAKSYAEARTREWLEECRTQNLSNAQMGIG